MSRYSETDTTSQAGDWLMGTARRNPEALLLLAAGACLLMRSGGKAGSAADCASDVKERISDAASGYADSVSEFADDARRAITDRSEHWQGKRTRTFAVDACK